MNDRKAPPFDWTPERCQLVAELWAAGEPRATLIAQLGCSPWQFDKYRRRALAPRDRWADSRQHDISDEDFRILWATGRPCREIAAYLEWPPTAVYGRAARMGLPPRHKHQATRRAYIRTAGARPPLERAVAELFPAHAALLLNSTYHWHKVLTDEQRNAVIWRARELAKIPHLPLRPPTSTFEERAA